MGGGGVGGVRLLGINIYFNSISSLDGTILPSHARWESSRIYINTEGEETFAACCQREKPITFCSGRVKRVAPLTIGYVHTYSYI